MTCKSQQLFAGFCFPYFNIFVITTTSNFLSIGIKAYACNPRSMPLKSLQFFASFWFPDFDGIIYTTAGDLIPIWTEAYAINETSMPLESLQFLASFYFPYFNVIIITTTSDFLTIETKTKNAIRIRHKGYMILVKVRNYKIMLPTSIGEGGRNQFF